MIIPQTCHQQNHYPSPGLTGYTESLGGREVGSNHSDRIAVHLPRRWIRTQLAPAVGGHAPRQVDTKYRAWRSGGPHTENIPAEAGNWSPGDSKPRDWSKRASAKRRRDAEHTACSPQRGPQGSGGQALPARGLSVQSPRAEGAEHALGPVTGCSWSDIQPDPLHLRRPAVAPAVGSSALWGGKATVLKALISSSWLGCVPS